MPDHRPWFERYEADAEHGGRQGVFDGSRCGDPDCAYCQPKAAAVEQATFPLPIVGGFVSAVLGAMQLWRDAR